MYRQLLPRDTDFGFPRLLYGVENREQGWDRPSAPKLSEVGYGRSPKRYCWLK